MSEAVHSTRRILNQDIPHIGSAVPHRGNWFTQHIAVFFLALTGWQISGSIPNQPKLVVVGAPHTSNWDFPLVMMIVFALGVRIEIMGKHTLFRGPFDRILRWLGVYPVDRRAANGIVGQTIEEINQREKLLIGVSPEGTRKKAVRWKTGFYHIARGANVPILPVSLDYGKKTATLHPTILPSGKLEEDMAHIKAHYQHVAGRHVDKF